MHYIKYYLNYIKYFQFLDPRLRAKVLELLDNGLVKPRSILRVLEDRLPVVSRVHNRGCLTLIHPRLGFFGPMQFLIKTNLKIPSLIRNDPLYKWMRLLGVIFDPMHYKQTSTRQKDRKYHLHDNQALQDTTKRIAVFTFHSNIRFINIPRLNTHRSI